MVLGQAGDPMNVSRAEGKDKGEDKGKGKSKDKGKTPWHDKRKGYGNSNGYNQSSDSKGKGWQGQKKDKELWQTHKFCCMSQVSQTRTLRLRSRLLVRQRESTSGEWEGWWEQQHTHTHHSERTTRSFPNKSWERQKCSNSGTYFWSARWWTRDCREPECSCSDMWTFFHWWWWWRCCFHCEHVPEFHLLKDMVQKKKEQILGGRLFVRTVWTDEVNIILDSGSDATVFPHEFVETGKDTNNLSQLCGAQGHPRWVNTSNWILSKDWAIWDLGPASTSTRWPFVDVRAGGFVPILHRIYLLRIACPLTSRVQCVYRRKHRWLVYCNGKNSNIRNSNIV